jgi:diguanylate cyclase (GGDEF)-like protein
MNDLHTADSLMHRFTPEEVRAFHQAGAHESYEAKDTILTRGDEGDSMFIILSGTARVLLEEGGEPILLKEGSYFGELSFINPDHKRSTTIVADTACELLVLNQKSAESLFREVPTVLFTLLRRACAFLVEKEEALISNLKRQNRELERTLDYLRRTKEELDYQELLAQTDELTGLYNRRCLMEQLSRCVDRANRTGESLALVILDLDHFKPVNDELGHMAGDKILKSIASIMKTGIRRSDLPCRLGGDEFAIVLPNVQPHIAATRAETIRRQIELVTFLENAPEHDITASLGGTMFVPGETVEQLVKRADDELYRAKMKGRNRLSWG